MTVTLTRRGRAVVGICVVGVLLAWLSGARSLNAIVLPGAVALGAAYLQLRGLEPPRVDRRLPPDDFVGATHAVRLSFGDSDGRVGDLDRPFVADVRDSLGPGLRGPDEPVRTTVGEEPVANEVTYERRGTREFGPVTLAAIDVFGLLERDLLCRGKERIVVYPERHPVPPWFRRELYRDEEVGPSRQRNEFDRLREYARGDALRDVHWPATAKRDELIVKEFAAEAEQRRVHLSGGARGDSADDLAEAATSVALALLDDGVPVTVTLPNGSVEVRPGLEDRRRLLELLAFATRGSVPDPAADVVIDADSTGTAILLDGSEFRFGDLVDAAGRTAAIGEPAGGADPGAGSLATDGGGVIRRVDSADHESVAYPVDSADQGGAVR